MPTLFLTGSTGALGSAIREKYLAEGWNVAAFSRKDDGFHHEHYRFWSIDATNETSVEHAFAEAASAHGTPRALVATIGGVRSWNTVVETSLEDFRALLDMNLVSVFLAAKHAMRFMAEGGTIVSFGAEAALAPTAKRNGYAASKAGLVALTRVMAEEGKSSGVTANCIVPTIIRTKDNESWGDPNNFEKWTKPEDMAAMCFFLTSEAGKAVNGAVIRMPNRI